MPPTEHSEAIIGTVGFTFIFAEGPQGVAIGVECNGSIGPQELLPEERVFAAGDVIERASGWMHARLLNVFLDSVSASRGGSQRRRPTLR